MFQKRESNKYCSEKGKLFSLSFWGGYYGSLSHSAFIHLVWSRPLRADRVRTLPWDSVAQGNRGSWMCAEAPTSLHTPTGTSLVWAPMTCYLNYSNSSLCSCPWLLAWYSPSAARVILLNYISHVIWLLRVLWLIICHSSQQYKLNIIRRASINVLGHYCIPSTWKNTWSRGTVSSHLLEWMDFRNNLFQDRDLIIISLQVVIETMEGSRLTIEWSKENQLQPSREISKNIYTVVALMDTWHLHPVWVIIWVLEEFTSYGSKEDILMKGLYTHMWSWLGNQQQGTITTH